MIRALIAVLLLLAPGASRAQDTRDIDTLWKEACLWEVGSNAEIVPAARKALIARGESVIEWLIPAKLDTKDTLITRALTVVVTGIGGPTATSLLMTALESDNANVRRNAADLLGALGAKDAAPAIARLLGDPDARLGALSALSALGSREPVPAIAALLADESANERSRVQAAATLGKIGGPDAIIALAARLGAREAAVRYACQYALQIDEAAPTLRGLLQHADERVRLHAMAALGAIAGPASRQSILARLSDQSPIMRGYAAEALARVQEPTDAAYLRSLLRRETDPFARGKLEAAVGR